MKNTAKQSAPKNNLTATGEYYDGKIETIDYLESTMDALVRNGVPASRAYDVVAALKYLSSRLGSKSETPIELDLMKAENYIHRARTGKWLDKEFLDPFGGEDATSESSQHSRPDAEEISKGRAVRRGL